jgi:transposase InsO family protein
MVKEFPFPIQRIQTDRGGEFIAQEFQDELSSHKIKFRPNRPRAPHLNGKVERSQKTDRMEFWATIELCAPRETLQSQLQQWQQFYNQERTHSAIASQTPFRRWKELAELVPTLEAVQNAYKTPERSIKNSYYVWAGQDEA